MASLVLASTQGSTLLLTYDPVGLVWNSFTIANNDRRTLTIWWSIAGDYNSRSMAAGQTVFISLNVPYTITSGTSAGMDPGMDGYGVF